MKYLLFLILIVSCQLSAHETVETNTCNIPTNTGRITSDMEMEMFQAELIIYERCMFDYIRDQQRQADIHDQAAEQAFEIWNDYLSNR